MTAISPLVLAIGRALVARALDLLAPPRCAACDAPLPRDVVFCPACATTVEPADAGGARHDALDDLRAACVYGGAVAVAVRRFKYQARPDLARALGHVLRATLRAAPVEVDLVVPVPLHARRLAERGYDQAALLGAHVARELRAPHAPRAITRVRATPKQAASSRAERLVNVEGAFVARPLAGARVALVDDVVTTGATLGACARALRAAGASSVVGVVLARAAPP
jgi:ComF family protein